jgi:hypothetical protein
MVSNEAVVFRVWFSPRFFSSYEINGMILNHKELVMTKKQSLFHQIYDDISLSMNERRNMYHESL